MTSDKCTFIDKNKKEAHYEMDYYEGKAHTIYMQPSEAEGLVKVTIEIPYDEY